MKAFLQHPLVQKALPSARTVAMFAAFALIGAYVLARLHVVLDADTVLHWWQHVLGVRVPPQATGSLLNILIIASHASAWWLVVTADEFVGLLAASGALCVLFAILYPLNAVLKRIAPENPAQRL
ncbi:hypothetical protein [Burkholderia sp. WTPI3]|uniref:hypothetical protein n=1 Tax=Burkholderia sp. WTPI3 TaxID=2822167 RepID=UPI001F1B91F3|nr:hypothetical protein [Burkholderia sp. WTPI3]